MSYTEIAALAKEVGLWSGIATLLWKGISFLQAATKTAKAIPVFMQSTTKSLGGLQVLVQQAVGNHLTHIETAVTETADSNKIFASNMETLRGDFQDFMKDSIETSTKILERLPEL
jgi:hypothetical protein